MTKTPLLEDLLDVLENIASFELAEIWDNVGLMVGSPNQELSGVLVALDPTEELLDEALQCGANAIITHHPLIFQALKSIRTDLTVGRFLQKAIEKEISVVGCHTNLDMAAGGVNDALASTIGLTDVQSLTNKGSGPPDVSQGLGFGRLGQLPNPMTGEELVTHLHNVLKMDVLAVAGTLPKKITSVAVCGGSGSEFAEAAFNKGAQVYITGEVKHSTARWAESCDFCVIDAGHYATENPVVQNLVSVLQNAFIEKEWQPTVRSTERQLGPIAFYSKPGT